MPESAGTGPTGNRLSLSIDPLKYIDNLPEFGGAQNELQTFVESIDEITPYMSKYDAVSQKIFLTCIKTKIKGRAKTVVEINTHANTWDALKEVLNQNFSDSKSSLQLYDELRSVTFRTNASDLYNNIQNILRRLNNKTKVEHSTNEVNEIIQSNIRSAVDIFKNKIAEPMKSILFSRDPKTLEECFKILTEGNYLYYSPFGNNKRNNNEKNFKPKNPIAKIPQNYVTMQNPQPSNNNNYYHNKHSPNYNRSMFNTRNNFGNNSNRNFRPNYHQRHDNRQIEPMDIDTPSTSRVIDTHVMENFPITASEEN